MKPATRLTSLPPYAFAEIDRLRDERRAAGADVIDFGVGDPTEPLPDVVIEAIRSGVVSHARSGYPSYVGSDALRQAAAAWLGRRFGVELDAATQLTASIGSKESIFHLPEAFVDPGDVVLCPSPGYPPYVSGTRFAEGRVVLYAVERDGPLLPDLDALDDDVAERLRVVWVTQPHVPTGRMASLAELTRLADQCRARGVLLCSDEAYSELFAHAPPVSALETGLDHVLAFHSLSKRSCMTGSRVGFVAGDPEAVGYLRRLKTNIDSGVPRYIEDGAIAALADENAPAAARQRYRERAALLVPALRSIGCEVAEPDAGFYLWVRAPNNESGVSFSKQLLSSETAIVAMPGEWLAEVVQSTGRSPGSGMVRFALMPSDERCREAAERLVAWGAPSLETSS